MRQWCNQQFALEITTTSARETLKRLSGDNEAVYREGVWWPGDEIKDTEENEPRDGNAVGGPDAGSLFGAQSRH